MECYNGGKLGHLANECRHKKTKSKEKKEHKHHSSDESSDDEKKKKRSSFKKKSFPGYTAARHLAGLSAR